MPDRVGYVSQPNRTFPRPFHWRSPGPRDCFLREVVPDEVTGRVASSEQAEVVAAAAADIRYREAGLERVRESVNRLYQKCLCHVLSVFNRQRVNSA